MSPPTWEALFKALVEAAPEGRTLVVVVDDAHRWWNPGLDSARPFKGPWTGPEASERSVHVTLVAPELPSTKLKEENLLPPLRMLPLSFRAAHPFLPGTTTWERLRSYTVFGGLPGILIQLDRKASLEANLRRLVLDRDAPFRDLPLTLLERAFQRPSRYAAILAALAGGEGDWGSVQAGVGRSDGQRTGRALPQAVGGGGACGGSSFPGFLAPHPESPLQDHGSVHRLLV